MRGMLLALLLSLSLFGAADAKPLTSKAFTDEVVRQLAQKLPAGAVEVKGELTLAIRKPDGGELTVWLTNPYQDYRRAPARLGEIVSTYVDALTAPATAGKLDRSRVVPVIKDRQWVEEMRSELRKRGVTTPPEHKVEDFNGHLVIVYAEDDPQTTR
jgi:hypothetical protein